MIEATYGSSPQTLLNSPHATVRSAARLRPDRERDLLKAIADEMADHPAVWVPNGVSILSQPNKPSPVWTAACRLALAVLFKDAPDVSLCNDTQESCVPGFPASHCTRPAYHPGWHYEGETYCWGERGEEHGVRDPWTGRRIAEEE